MSSHVGREPWASGAPVTIASHVTSRQGSICEQTIPVQPLEERTRIRFKSQAVPGELLQVRPRPRPARLGDLEELERPRRGAEPAPADHAAAPGDPVLYQRRALDLCP